MNNFDNERTEPLLNEEANTEGAGVATGSKRKKITKWIVLGLSVIAIILLCLVASYFIKRYQYNEKITQGVDLINNKDYAGAKTALDGAVAIDPNNPEAYELLLDVGVNQYNTDLIDQSTDKLLELGLSSSDIDFPTEFPSGNANIKGVDSKTLGSYSNPEQFDTDLEFFKQLIKKGMASFRNVKSYDQVLNESAKIAGAGSYAAYSVDISINQESELTYDRNSNERNSKGTTVIDTSGSGNGRSTTNNETYKFDSNWKNKTLTTNITNDDGKTRTDHDTTKTDPNLYNDLSPFLKANDVYIEEDSDSYVIFCNLDFNVLMEGGIIEDSSNSINPEGTEPITVRLVLDKTYCLPVSLYLDGTQDALKDSIGIPKDDGEVEQLSLSADFSNYTFE